MLLLPILSFAQTEKPSFTYFYADWCPHCQNVNKFFKDNGVYEKYDVQKLNFDKAENKIKLKKLFEEKGYGGQSGIPAILYEDKLLVGDTPIIDFFKKELEKFSKEEKEIPKIGNALNNIPLWALIGGALADASNPCALAVLILLLASVISAKGKNHALFSGLMFSLAIFISYFLMGLGIYTAISAFGIPRYLSLGVGMLAIILALANFKDVFWYGKVFITEVPMAWRPKMQAIIKRATNPWSAFGIGFLVSLFLVPCASGPYVVILGMIAEKTPSIKPMLLLVLYNFIFVFPMLAITAAMYFFNTRMGKLEQWRQKNLRLLHAIIGTIMLLLGIYLIYSRI